MGAIFQKLQKFSLMGAKMETQCVFVSSWVIALEAVSLLCQTVFGGFVEVFESGTGWSWRILIYQELLRGELPSLFLFFCLHSVLGHAEVKEAYRCMCVTPTIPDKWRKSKQKPLLFLSIFINLIVSFVFCVYLSTAFEFCYISNMSSAFASSCFLLYLFLSSLPLLLKIPL